MDKLNTKDPIVDRFRILTDDAPMNATEPAWLFKVVGDA